MIKWIHLNKITKIRKKDFKAQKVQKNKIMINLK